MTTTSTYIPSPAPVPDYLQEVIAGAVRDGLLTGAEARRALRQHVGCWCVDHRLPVVVFGRDGAAICERCVAEMREAGHG